MMGGIVVVVVVVVEVVVGAGTAMVVVAGGDDVEVAGSSGCAAAASAVTGSGPLQAAASNANAARAKVGRERNIGRGVYESTGFARCNAAAGGRPRWPSLG